MDNWDDLRFVVALARYGSMANASRHLRTNTATVSRRIKRLSEVSGTAFFQKSGSEWELTSEGRDLYELAAGFGDDLRAFYAVQKEDEDSNRIIRITAVEFLINEVLSEALPAFRRRHPNITLELSASDKKVSLAYGDADIALRLTRPTEGRLIAKRIADIKMGVFGPAKSKENSWIGLPFDLDWTPEMKNGLAVFGSEPAIRVASFRSVIKAMEATKLPGILPEIMAGNLAGFLPLQPRREMRIRELWLLFHETRKQDAALRDTCKWIEESFAIHCK